MAKRIKILFTIPNFDTAGSGRVVHDLVKGLDKTRFAPEICSFHDRGAFFKTVQELGVPIHIFNVTTPYRPLLTFPFRVLKICRFFKQHRFDIIHSWHWSSDFSEPLAAKWAGIPFVYTKKAMGWGNKAWTWRSKLSTKIIAVNREMMKVFFFKMKNKTVNIPLGVDTDYFKPNHISTLDRKNLGLNPDNFVVITVANLVPVKGIEVLIKAIELLNDKNVKLLVVGDFQNDYGLELKKSYENNQILFLGIQQDVRPFITLADLFVIPTKNEGRKEGMPIAPLEAMASECVVLGSRVAGITDILSNFPNLIFEPNNAVRLMEKIQEIQSLTKKERKTIGVDLRKCVIQFYMINQFILSHEKVYHKILNK